MTQDYIFFLLNGRPMQVRGEHAFSSLAEFLRRQCALTGTKIACAQGACGACTVLIARPKDGALAYSPINSCLQRVFQVHGCHVVTVEGLHGADERDPELNPIQQAMWENHASQCGFCTPGFVMSLTMHGESEDPALTPETTKRTLCGNLCRCTGYTAILEAAQDIEWARHKRLEVLYPPAPLVDRLKNGAESALVSEGGHLVCAPTKLSEALEWRAAHPDSTPLAGGTEFGTVEVAPNRPIQWLSLGGIEQLKTIAINGPDFILGAAATWSEVQPAVADALPEFADLLDRWGSPQLRAAGTVGGSILNASPISDVLPLLLVCEAELELHGPIGERRVPVSDVISPTGPDLRPGELLIRVHVPLPRPAGATLTLRKISRRNSFDRAVVNAAFWSRPGEIRLAFGGAGSRVLRLTKTEAFLSSGVLLESPATWKQAAAIAQTEIDPKTDGTAGAPYRRQLVTNLLLQWGRETFAGVMA